MKSLCTAITIWSNFDWKMKVWWRKWEYRSICKFIIVWRIRERNGGALCAGKLNNNSAAACATVCLLSLYLHLSTHNDRFVDAHRSLGSRKSLPRQGLTLIAGGKACISHRVKTRADGNESHAPWMWLWYSKHFLQFVLATTSATSNTLSFLYTSLYGKRQTSKLHRTCLDWTEKVPTVRIIYAYGCECCCGKKMT